MKKVFKIEDKNIINSVFDKAEYGTLALSYNDEPYAVAVNFVRIGESIYFHGALNNKKMKILAKNPKVSFSVVESYSIIDSYFSSHDGLACPATHFFKSVSIDGVAEVIENQEEKALMFEAMMKKLQPSGGYKSFSDEAYNKALKTTAVVKIVPSTISCKFKFGQHLDTERFEMIVKHLQERGSEVDLAT
ncbi:MAG: pyridoxamine 5'-phosphate oxidase family protein, partial [Sulfurovum sp.]|nr:pyridoxamine 5'-phosphate oxidase family protein [Sulfurovum sp.]